MDMNQSENEIDNRIDNRSKTKAEDRLYTTLPNEPKEASARLSKQERYEQNKHANMQRQLDMYEQRRKKGPRAILPVPTTKEEFISKAERAISRMIDQDHPAAVIFTLKSLGASKGWIEKSVSEEVDLGKLNALKSFFDSVPTKEVSASEQSEKATLPIPEPLVNPDLPQAKTAPLRTNFP